MARRKSQRIVLNIAQRRMYLIPMHANTRVFIGVRTRAAGAYFLLYPTYIFRIHTGGSGSGGWPGPIEWKMPHFRAGAMAPFSVHQPSTFIYNKKTAEVVNPHAMAWRIRRLQPGAPLLAPHRRRWQIYIGLISTRLDLN